MGLSDLLSSSFESLVSGLLSPHCYDELVLKQHFFDMACNKMLLSKILGYAILVGSLLVKLPQIVKIKWNKSGVGISVFAETIMLVAIFGTMAYGYSSGYALSVYVLCSIAGFLMFQNLLPPQLVKTLAGLSLVFSLISRLLQSISIYRDKSTGNLSAITVLMLFFGSIARIFTSIQETGDPTLIWTYVLNTLAISLLIFQLGYYWSASVPTIEQTKKQQ
ncbi:unnamed protein product [Adineta ricciae]|uniref:Mannose-P-dolichol utilization defect 1 protein homolog n=1 Tax=Adineta ricciae TaxID=249248 RepID=A0A815IWV6_ADIRI|nr:unnamed protein product [Adineta ricciae]